VLHAAKEKRNIRQLIKRRNANLIGHNWRINRLLKHAIKGKIEEMGKATKKT
jgi:hypothetical protein